MFTAAHNLFKSFACLVLIAGTVSACSTMVAPEEDGTTEYVFGQAGDDQVLSKDESGTAARGEED
ncbi:MAG TPA: hypothetical protein VMO47_16070 [Rhodothermales bacterium]|nr:hypothetical protein [Rhodothermales bacterium]